MREIEETNHISETVLVSFSDVEAILTDTSKDVLSFSGLEIFVKEQTVCKDGLLVPLSYYEFFTLYFLAQYPRWVFSKKQIYEAVWKQPGEKCEAVVANVISRIRRKLNPENPKDGYIKTIINSGYRFEP